MDKIEKIGNIEAICLIVTVIVNQIIFNVPNIILQTTGSSAWINVILISIVAIAFTYIICKLFKNFPSLDIVDISKYLGGNTLKYIIGIIYIVFFFVFNVLCICYFANNIKLIYFNKTPLVVLAILFIIPPVIINKYGLKAISSITLLFTPFVLFSVFVLFLGSKDEFTLQHIFPILGFGAKETFLYGLTNLFSFSGLAYMFFLNPFLKKNDDFKKVSLISIIISAIYLFLTVLCLLLSFAFITVNEQMFSLYLLTRILEFGTFLQRVDAIFILIWILNTFCFTSLGFFYIVNIFKKLTNIKDSKQILYPVSALVFSGVLFFNNIADIKLYARILYKYFDNTLIFIVSLIILIFANVKLKKSKEVK